MRRDISFLKIVFLFLICFISTNQIYCAVHCTLNIIPLQTLCPLIIHFNFNSISTWHMNCCSKASSQLVMNTNVLHKEFSEKLLLFKKKKKERGRWMKMDENGNGSDIRYRGLVQNIPAIFIPAN